MAKAAAPRKKVMARAGLLALRKRERARREKDVISASVRLMGLPPAATLRMMMELSDLCMKLSDGGAK
jgi:hypothetical protein